MTEGMEITDGEKPKKTKYVSQSPGTSVIMAMMLISKHPNLDLSGQQLGRSFIAPYLIGGNWNVIDLSGCEGHVVIRGYAHKLILKEAAGIFVRLIGDVGYLDARNINCDAKGHSSRIDLNGDIFELDLRGSVIEELQVIHSIAEPGCDPSLQEAKAGKVKIKPFDIRYVVSDDPRGWHRAIAGNLAKRG